MRKLLLYLSGIYSVCPAERAASISARMRASSLRSYFSSPGTGQFSAHCCAALTSCRISRK